MRSTPEGFFVLFDGLDEVTRDNQTRVVNLIKRLRHKWGIAKYVTTCRIAVYTGQLLPQFSSTVAITDSTMPGSPDS